MRFVAVIVPIFVVMVVLLLPNPADASVRLSNSSIIVSPKAPGPNAPAQVSIERLALETLGGSVRWFVDGVEMVSAQDKPSIEIMTRETGRQTLVEVRVGSGSGRDEVMTAMITPARLDLIVGSDSSVPSFYKGRALPGLNSQISVQAFVFGASNPGPYSYRWFVNGNEVLGTAGNRTGQIVVTPNLSIEMAVEVEVTDRLGDVVAAGSTLIPLATPEIHFYESNPLQGLIPAVLTSPYYFLNEEITLRAEPYYFAGPRSGFAIEWQIDNRKTESEGDPLQLTLLKTQEEGEAWVELDIINKNNYLETAEAGLQITY